MTLLVPVWETISLSGLGRTHFSSTERIVAITNGIAYVLVIWSFKTYIYSILDGELFQWAALYNVSLTLDPGFSCVLISKVISWCILGENSSTIAVSTLDVAALILAPFCVVLFVCLAIRCYIKYHTYSFWSIGNCAGVIMNTFMWGFHVFLLTYHETVNNPFRRLFHLGPNPSRSHLSHRSTLTTRPRWSSRKTYHTPQRAVSKQLRLKSTAWWERTATPGSSPLTFTCGSPRRRPQVPTCSAGGHAPVYSTREERPHLSLQPGSANIVRIARSVVRGIM